MSHIFLEREILSSFQLRTYIQKFKTGLSSPLKKSKIYAGYLVNHKTQ